MPSTTLDLATSTIAADQVADLAKSTEKPIVTTSAVPPTLGEGCDLSSLLTFDPESIEPTSSKASGEPSLSTVHGPLQRLKDLLSSSTETLIENSEEVKGILEDIQPHLPMTLQVKLWPAVTLSVFKSRVQSARQRITLRRTQLPLRADIAEKCQRLNEKKAALDAKTDTSANRAELETLRKELESLEERVRVTKQLIQDKEALIARSQDEAKGLTADLKTDLAEIRTLSSQLVTGKDEDDEAEIAEVDRIRVDALHALDAFLQFHVGAGIPGVAPHYISPPSTFNVLLGSYWFDKPWFLTEGKLAVVHIIPSSWGSQQTSALPSQGSYYAHVNCAQASCCWDSEGIYHTSAALWNGERTGFIDTVRTTEYGSAAGLQH
ncbi:hypothetical protein QYE76_054093 [Lolium multiflorum]|uniref:Uncharacterized protein n=1 Tax=Lolium multiflorum TaxID=4521 RepID=A0AAD8WKP3_LOLMU|nr:hypothetical protein QYE76_054093 [Lolium multiflorum]